MTWRVGETTKTPSISPPCMAPKTRLISASSVTDCPTKSRLSATPACRTFGRSCDVKGSLGSCKTSTRRSWGTICLNSSSFLSGNSKKNAANHVRLPPGWDRLDTSPAATGSLACRKTIGISVVTALAARMDWFSKGTSRSTPSRTNLVPFCGPLPHRVHFASQSGFSPLLVSQPFQSYFERVERRRNVVQTDVEKPDPPDLCRRLRVSIERCYENGDDEQDYDLHGTESHNGLLNLTRRGGYVCGINVWLPCMWASSNAN